MVIADDGEGGGAVCYVGVGVWRQVPPRACVRWASAWVSRSIMWTWRDGRSFLVRCVSVENDVYVCACARANGETERALRLRAQRRAQLPV